MTEENVFARDLQAVRDAIAALVGAANNSEGDLPDLFAEVRLPADVFGQLLMNHLPMGRMDVEDMAFWLAVMTAIGPDYVAEFRRVGGFMNKLGEF